MVFDLVDAAALSFAHLRYDKACPGHVENRCQSGCRGGLGIEVHCTESTGTYYTIQSLWVPTLE